MYCLFYIIFFKIFVPFIRCLLDILTLGIKIRSIQSLSDITIYILEMFRYFRKVFIFLFCDRSNLLKFIL